MDAIICPACQTPNAPDVGFCHVCGTPFDELEAGFAPLPTGTLVRENTLRIEETLGQGGFGITYRATEISSGRIVAVKEFFPFGCVRQNGHVRASALMDAAQWRQSRDDFLREARLLMGHAHPNIVQVLEVWQERGTALLAMELLRGETLAARLKRGPLRESEILPLLEHIGGALQTLHEHSLLHRDIKPDNIMLCAGDDQDPHATRRAVLLDFGAARHFHGTRTQTMTQIVTPGYAPLEQYGTQARFGTYTDLYALGATMYHALTGRAPAAATDRAVGESVIAPENINPHISHRLSEAIMWALQMRVDERPQSVAQWLDAVRYGRSELLTESSETIDAPTEIIEDKAADTSLPSLRAAKKPAREAENLERDDVLSLPILSGDNETWYRVKIDALRVTWLKRCACCLSPMITTLDVRTPTVWWQIPYCAQCRAHAESGQNIEGVSTAAAIGSGVLGLMLCASEVFRPGAFFLLGGPLVFRGGAELWLQFKAWRHRSAHAACENYRPAARCLGKEGRAYVWEFRNRAYAEEFCRANTPVARATTNTYRPFDKEAIQSKLDHRARPPLL